jgi:hypothetical protein
VQTLFGDIVLPSLYGRDRESGTMLMPIREALGLYGQRPMSPSLEDRLCHLALTATSYRRRISGAIRDCTGSSGMAAITISCSLSSMRRQSHIDPEE